MRCKNENTKNRKRAKHIVSAALMLRLDAVVASRPRPLSYWPLVAATSVLGCLDVTARVARPLAAAAASPSFPAAVSPGKIK